MPYDSFRYENERGSKKFLLDVFKIENQKQNMNNITTYGQMEIIWRHILMNTCKLKKKALNLLIFVH